MHILAVMFHKGAVRTGLDHHGGRQSGVAGRCVADPDGEVGNERSPSPTADGLLLRPVVRVLSAQPAVMVSGPSVAV
ncbi:hypothetical protein GCM10029976_056940 [Kribbella albertanoniae]